MLTSILDKSKLGVSKEQGPVLRVMTSYTDHHAYKPLKETDSGMNEKMFW